MSYFQTLRDNYKLVKAIRTRGIKLWQNKFPSQTHFKYIPSETFGGKRVLNIGCGRCTFKAPNVVNLDGTPDELVNVVWDLSKTPLPFPDNSFDLIIANHVLEHIPNWFECFKDLARVLDVGGRIEVWVPPVSSDSAFAYRDHINRIGFYSFSGCRNFNRGGTNLAAITEFSETAKEPIQSLDILNWTSRPIVTWWTMLAPAGVLSWMMTHLRNVVSEEGYFFIKRGK